MKRLPTSAVTLPIDPLSARLGSALAQPAVRSSATVHGWLIEPNRPVPCRAVPCRAGPISKHSEMQRIAGPTCADSIRSLASSMLAAVDYSHTVTCLLTAGMIGTSVHSDAISSAAASASASCPNSKHRKQRKPISISIGCRVYTLSLHQQYCSSGINVAHAVDRGTVQML